MRRYVIGILGGAVAFLGMALQAEAQNPDIRGTGPSAVCHNQSQSTYTATVTWSGPANFKVWLYHNSVLKAQSPQYQLSVPGTLDVSHTFSGMNTWGMVAGHQLKYRGKVWCGLMYDLDDWFVTVSQGTSKLIPRKETPAAPYREELLAEAPRHEEREWA